MTVIEADTLTTFEVAGDGGRVRFNCEDREGTPVALSLPVASMLQMVMSLPRIAQEALRRWHKDDALRVVYPAGSWKFERDTVVRLRPAEAGGDRGGHPRSVIPTHALLRPQLSPVHGDFHGLQHGPLRKPRETGRLSQPSQAAGVDRPNAEPARSAQRKIHPWCHGGRRVRTGSRPYDVAGERLAGAFC
jgi:hypothetical protein